MRDIFFPQVHKLVDFVTVVCAQYITLGVTVVLCH